MLQVRNIEKYYGSKNNVTKALDRVSFEVDDGEFIAIMGASYAARVLFLKDGRLFHELLRGERGRPVFYHEVLDVLALLGGDVSDVI